jgi:hypothetical protein
MLKLIEGAAIGADGFFGITPQEFPFTFLPGYAHFIDLNGEKVVFLQHLGLQATAPIRLFPRRVIRSAQWLSPPMREGQRLHPADEEDFVELANTFLRRNLSCDRLIQPPNQALFQVTPFGSKNCQFGTYLVPLAGRTEGEVFASFHPETRRRIRKAITEGVRVSLETDALGAFFQAYQETMARSKLTGASLEELNRFRKTLGPQNVACTVAFDREGTPLGGSFGARTKESCYCLFGASADRTTIGGAVRLAHWELIRDCIRRGIRQYDFVGARLSDVSGTKLQRVQEFKSKFGSTLRKGYLWKMDLRPTITGIFDTANGVRRAYRWLRTGSALNYPDIIDQEQTAATRARPVLGA